MVKSFQQEASEELQFWLQILGDHSRFIHDSLAPGQTAFIDTAAAFRDRFDTLLDRSKQSLNQEEWLSLASLSKTESEAIREFKLAILKEQLVGNIKISLPPPFVNHMVNEVEEAIRILSFLEKGESPPLVHPLHHDLLWLLDAAGHAGAIDANMDRVEKQLKKKSRKFVKDWEAFYLKAIELAGFLRTNVTKFPALDKFHNDVYLEMTIFKTFLGELEEMGLNKENLGVFTPLMADHMAREECYYLMKLAESAGTPDPYCNPAKREYRGIRL
ncbi:DUF2935 domain-containing protein [Sporosarcina sp. ACRSL]|uniref:DUF2935 domain-containing protein n=1 Tax=Sporosarcina sp. ACRSL TaxID=2918215 RepID=UPI001EF70D67|nr:DUF2935 domain-containing protein [Sporosarcina sp. ACRSL]MCG7342605.1 DUF2935 domain-containing protein [Sporosarcina sp. ACRSL]